MIKTLFNSIRGNYYKDGEFGGMVVIKPKKVCVEVNELDVNTMQVKNKTYGYSEIEEVLCNKEEITTYKNKGYATRSLIGTLAFGIVGGAVAIATGGKREKVKIKKICYIRFSDGKEYLVKENSSSFAKAFKCKWLEKTNRKGDILKEVLGGK